MVLGSAAVGTATLSGTAQAGSHPKIASAIAALEEAREYLRQAKHTFGGNKKDAIAHLGRAIDSLKTCMKY
jgi:outer membrane murein-binding lipoprotein Lpp